jgi:chemotaxis family two-component system response regulator Rcp1
MIEGPDQQTFRIVLVEDNAADIYLFRQALKRAELHCELTVIKDGGDALAFAKGDAKRTSTPVPDLLVLDLNLPKVGGCEVLAAVRQNLDLAHLTVAIMTSSAALQDRQKCDQLGVDRYIIKPLDLEEFLRIGETVKQILLESRPDRPQ